MVSTHEGGVESHDVEQNSKVEEFLKKAKSLKSEYVLGYPSVGDADGNRGDRLRALLREIDALSQSEDWGKVSEELRKKLSTDRFELLKWHRMLGEGATDMVSQGKNGGSKEMTTDLRGGVLASQEPTPYSLAANTGNTESPSGIKEVTQGHVPTELRMPEEDVTMFSGLLCDLAERQVSLGERVRAVAKQGDELTQVDVCAEVETLTKEYRELDEVWLELKERHGSSMPEVLQKAHEQVVAGDETLREALGTLSKKVTPKDALSPGEVNPPHTPLKMEPIEHGGHTFRGLVRTLAGIRERIEADGVSGAEITATWEKVRTVEREWGRARENHLTETEEDDTLAKELFKLKKDLGTLEVVEFTAIKHTLEEMKGRVAQGVMVPPTELAELHKKWWRMQMEPWWNVSYNTTMSKLVSDIQSAMRRGEAEPKKAATDVTQVPEEAPSVSSTSEEKQPQPVTVEALSFREQLKALIERQEQAMATGGGVEAYARFAGEVARVREQWELLYRTPPYDEEEFELCATVCRKQNLLYEDLYEGVHEDPYWRAARAEYGALKRDLENARSAYHAAMLAYYSEKPAGMLERLFVARGGKEKEEDLRAARAAYESVGAHMRDLCRSWVEVGAQREGLTDAERILEAEYARRLGARYLGKLEKEVKSTETKVAQIIAAHAAKREGGVERVVRFGTAVREWCRQRPVRTTIGGLLAGLLGMAPSNIGMDVSPTESVVAERVEPAPPDGRSPALERRSSGPVPGAPQAGAAASVEFPDERSTGEPAPSEVATLVEQQAPTEQGPTEIVTEAPQTEASGAGAPAEPQKEVRPTKQEQPTATGEQTKSPEANYLEGTYGPGDSIERVLQHMLSDPSSPFYQPELTGEEVGRVAHLACEALKRLDQKNTAYEIAEKLGVRGGDWDKVPEGGKYTFPDLMGRIFADISRYVRSLRGALKP